MASETAICNLALSMVGSSPIIDLSDDSKRARMCKAFYPVLRNEMLRGHLWNFATAEAVLAEKSEAPLFGFDKTFALPEDFLRLISMEDRYIEYRLQGNLIHSSESVIRIQYVYRVEDSEQFDSTFTTALAYRLATDLALPLADDNNLRNLMTASFRNAVATARSMDAQENPAGQIQADEWLDSRW